MKKQIFSLVLAMFLCSIGLCAGVSAAESNGTVIDMTNADGNLTITEKGYVLGSQTGPASSHYEIRGNSGQSIVFDGYKGEITIDSLTASAVNVQNASAVTLKLSGDNRIATDIKGGGININSGTSLVIDNADAGAMGTLRKDAPPYAYEQPAITVDGTLTIKNGQMELAGSGWESAILVRGALIIDGGKITAQGGNGAAGMGSGWYDHNSKGDITINGGEVIAKGGENAAGIGGGESGECGTITISGGNVVAVGNGSADIGKGSGYSSCKSVVIDGGNITKENKNETASISPSPRNSRGQEVSAVRMEVLNPYFYKTSIKSYDMGAENRAYNFKDVFKTTGVKQVFLPKETGQISFYMEDGSTYSGRLEGNSVSIDGQTDWDMSGLVYEDKSVFCDGKTYSLSFDEVQVPEGFTVLYLEKPEAVNAGTYTYRVAIAKPNSKTAVLSARLTIEETQIIDVSQCRYNDEIIIDKYGYIGSDGKSHSFSGSYIITGNNKYMNIKVIRGSMKIELRNLTCKKILVGESSWESPSLQLSGENNINSSLEVRAEGLSIGAADGGGTLNIKHEWESEAAILLYKNLIINSGTINVESNLGAGIGVGDQQQSEGTLTINGGEVNVKVSGNYTTAIGAGFYKSSFGKITISGGTVTTNGYIGLNPKSFNSSCGDIIINGGNVLSQVNTNGKIVNSAGKTLKQLSMTLPGITEKTKIEGLTAGGDSSYGLKDVITDEKGALTCWLPEDLIQNGAKITITTEGSKRLEGEIDNGSIRWIEEGDQQAVSYWNQNVYENETIPDMKIDPAKLPAGATVAYSVDQTPNGPGKYHYTAIVKDKGMETRYRATLTILALQKIGDIGVKDGASQEFRYAKEGITPKINKAQIPKGCCVQFSPERVTETGKNVPVKVTVSGRGYETKTMTVKLKMNKQNAFVSFLRKLFFLDKAAVAESAVAVQSVALEPVETAENTADQPLKLKLELAVGGLSKAVPKGIVTIWGKEYPLDGDGKLSCVIETSREELERINYQLTAEYTPAEDEEIYEAATLTATVNPDLKPRDAMAINYRFDQTDDSQNLTWDKTVKLTVTGGSKAGDEAYSYRVVDGGDFAAVTQDGEVSFTHSGNVVVEVRLEENETYSSIAQNISFYVSQIERDTTFKAQPVTYDGELHQILLTGDVDPDAHVEYIEADEDFEGNVPPVHMATDAGTYSAIVYVAGDDRYMEEQTFSNWVIKPRDVADVSISGVADSYAYTGSAVTPTPDEVKVNDDLYLNPGDYDLQYTNNIEKGTATMTLSGKGNFTGSVSKTFEIKENGQTSPSEPGQNGQNTSPSGKNGAGSGNTPTGIMQSADTQSMAAAALLTLLALTGLAVWRKKRQ